MLVECVPNVSEGRRPEIIEALSAAIAATEEAFLLDAHSDPDHNRTVFTFAGPRDAAVAAAYALVARAAELLDVRDHRGVHPRMGAVDVCPFVPLGGTPMEEAVRAARDLADRVGTRLGIPVYLYGEAALRPERRELPAVRVADIEGLARAIAADPSRAPDRGPAELHPRCGAIAVGARRPLVAFNVDLESGEKALAARIASRIREKGGGLPHLRALGFLLASRGKAQVSCNLLEGEITPPTAVLEAVRALAAEEGVGVARGELVGLVPRAVLYRAGADALALSSLGPDQVLEDRLERFLPLASYVRRIADPSGGPGGAAVAADAGALGAALCAFVSAVARGGEEPRFLRLAFRLLFLSRSDQDSYAALREARRRPPGPEREEAVAASLRRACDVPLRILETARSAIELAAALHAEGSIAVDIDVAVELLLAAARSARLTLEVNLRSPAARPFAEELSARAAELLAAAEAAGSERRIS